MLSVPLSVRSQQALRSGEWEWDSLILDDQVILLHVRDKGLVVLTGCGHAGIVNTVRYAQKLTGIEKIYAIIGIYIRCSIRLLVRG